jgi:hypothetical protein
MTKPIMCVLVAALLVLCAAAGCGSGAFTPYSGSGAETFLAVDVPEIGGPDGLAAKAGVADYSLEMVSLPEDILADAPDDIFLALRAEGITVVVDGEAAGRPSPAAKAQEHRTSVTFRLAEPDPDAYGAPGEVGSFALTITDGLVTLDRESAALDSRARSLVRAGRFEVCAETQADFDGSIAFGAVSFEFGRLRTTGWAQVDGRS